MRTIVHVEKMRDVRFFESEFTAGMEASLDGIEHGKIEAPDVWSNFVGGFSEAHTAALELRRSKPTPKQKSFLKIIALGGGLKE